MKKSKRASLREAWASMHEKLRRGLEFVTRGDIQFNVPMEKYTTFHAGGRAAALCSIGSLPQLKDLMSYLREEAVPYLIIGRGSNLLVKDTGFEGVAIGLKGDFARMEKSPRGKNFLSAGGGVTVHDLLRRCTEEGLSGLEFLAGVPGTVGGSVAMNAGSWGMDMGSVVREIDLLTAGGEIIRKAGQELHFSYRHLAIPSGSVVTTAVFELREESSEIIFSRIAGFLKQRKEKQPLEFPSAGSVFKNPPNDYAGRLIEAAGLKGARVGGSMISEKHANFIVNTGGAKAADILALMEIARERVMKKFGIELEAEIRVVGM